MAKQEFNEKDIALAWQKMAAEKFSNSQIKKDEIMTAIKMESHSSIAELKLRLKYKLYWSAFFTAAFIAALLVFLTNQDMVTLLVPGITAYLIGFIMLYVKYRKVGEGLPRSGDILESLKYNANQIKSVLRFEKTWGMIIFIPAIMMGILAGRVLGGHSLASCFQDPKILTIMLVAIVVFTPLLIWSSHMMNKFAFGKHLEKLENNIVKMETLQ
jgi:hypothetical protein